MSTKTKNQKPLIIAAIVFVVLVVAGVVIWQVTVPKGTAGAKAYTLTVVDADGKETVHNLNTDEEMLGTALQDADLIEGEESEYGLFVTKVDGIEADSANQEWWCLTINGENGLHRRRLHPGRRRRQVRVHAHGGVLICA